MMLITVLITAVTVVMMAMVIAMGVRIIIQLSFNTKELSQNKLIIM